MWQEKHGITSRVGNTDNLPGFDVSGNIQNAISQSGEYEPDTSMTSDDADLYLGPEIGLDLDGQIEDAALDKKLLDSGDMVNIV